MITTRVCSLIAAVVATLLATAIGAAAVDQDAIARNLSSDSREIRDIAYWKLQAMDPEAMNETTRAALITLLESLNDKSELAIAAGRTVDTVESPEFISSVASVVASLKDPRAIPVLAHDMSGTGQVQHALAAFGSAGVAEVLKVANDPRSNTRLIRQSLVNLRTIVKEGALSSVERQQIAVVARARLSIGGSRDASVLRNAMALGGTLGDAESVDIVKKVASSDDEVRARGVVDSRSVQATRDFAKLVLAQSGNVSSVQLPEQAQPAKK